MATENELLIAKTLREMAEVTGKNHTDLLHIVTQLTNRVLNQEAQIIDLRASVIMLRDMVEFTLPSIRAEIESAEARLANERERKIRDNEEQTRMRPSSKMRRNDTH